jgi:hypothetical protein
MRPPIITKKLLFLAIRDKLTRQEIADRHGVSWDAVNSALRRHRITYRPRERSGRGRPPVDHDTAERLRTMRVLDEAIARETLLPWERAEVPWDNVVYREMAQ